MAKMWRRRMGGMILCSMACTTVMLAVQGRIREAIPLHLCSVSALAAAVLAFMPVQPIVDYLWLLGMPGAILALVFPAPAVSPLADALHGLLHAYARADCAHWPERNGDGRMPARRKSADGADLFAGVCVDGVLCQSCAWNGFSIPVCAADRNAACVDRQCGIRRVYRLLTGDDDAAVSGDGRRGAAALRREVSTRRFFCYTKIKKCCIIKQNIGHIARFSDLPGMSARFSVSK